jgi:apolipoprotein N-acyltransferase
MTVDSKTEHAVRIAEPTVHEMIAEARSKKVGAPARGAWLLSCITGMLLWASFTPLNWSPLAWVALVPLLLLVRIHRPTVWMYRAIYATGFLSTLIMLQWMRLGDPAMYIAWFALSIYVAVYLPLFVGLVRTAVHRMSVPLTLAVPIIWVGLEFFRAHVMTGFSWYYLGHTQYRWIELIQVSDVVGAYGVSFLVATFSACVAGLVPISVFRRLKLVPPQTEAASAVICATPRRQIFAVAGSLALFALVLGYGYVRRSQADFQPGPRVALIQGNFDASLKSDKSMWTEMYFAHRRLTGMAVRHQPDLIVWPETMFRWPLFVRGFDTTDAELVALNSPESGVSDQQWLQEWRNPVVRERLADLSTEAGAAMMIGIETVSPGSGKLEVFNSVVYLDPQKGLSGRYDKMHRVLFGEYVPLKEQLPWLYKLTPFPKDWGLAAGTTPARFKHRDWSFAPIICFEDTVPHLVRNAVRYTAQEDAESKPVDFLVNSTNDGWFHGSSELDQHLITAAFRSVECRTPMVRAVNTGISAFIDGDGVIREPETFIDGEKKNRDSLYDPQTGRWRKRLNAALVSTVPLDSRSSLYVRWGDWFAALCALCVVIVMCMGLFGRADRKRPSKSPTTA